MPALPGYTAQLAPQGTLSVRAGGPPSVPGVDLQPFARALGNVATIENGIERAERASKVRRGQIDAERQLAEFEIELSTDTDYETHKQRYTDKRDAIRSEMMTQFGDDATAFQAWDNDFQPQALRSEVAVRTRAAKGRRDKQAAGLELDLQNYADAAAAAQSPDEKQRLRDEGMIAITDNLQRGIIAPMDAVKRQRKYRSDLIEAQVREDIRVDPASAEQALLSGDYVDLQGEARVKAIEMAGTRARQGEDRVWRTEERSYRMNEREQKRQADDAAREGDELLTGGGMTQGWLEVNRDRLDQSDYRYYLREVDGQRATATEDEAYSTLRDRAQSGDDVSQEARSALVMGRITQPAYDKLLTAQKMAAADEPSTNMYKRGFAMIKGSLEPGPYVKDPTPRRRQSEALDQWIQWNIDNPKATSEESKRERDFIIRENALVTWSDFAQVGKAPRYLVGNRGEPDLVETATATRDAFIAKHGGDVDAAESDPAYIEQGQLILEWNAAVEQMKQTGGGGGK